MINMRGLAGLFSSIILVIILIMISTTLYYVTMTSQMQSETIEAINKNEKECLFILAMKNTNDMYVYNYGNIPTVVDYLFIFDNGILVNGAPYDLNDVVVEPGEIVNLKLPCTIDSSTDIIAVSSHGRVYNLYWYADGTVLATSPIGTIYTKSVYMDALVLRIYLEGSKYKIQVDLTRIVNTNVDPRLYSINMITITINGVSFLVPVEELKYSDNGVQILDVDENSPGWNDFIIYVVDNYYKRIITVEDITISGLSFSGYHFISTNKYIIISFKAGCGDNAVYILCILCTKHFRS